MWFREMGVRFWGRDQKSYFTTVIKWTQVRLRPCSHYANFFLFCKKSGCQQEAISSKNDFFHLPNFLSCHQTSKMPSRGLQFFVMIRRHSFVPWQPSYFVTDQLTFLVIRKISRVSDANKVEKTKSRWLQNFQIFLQTPNSIFRRCANMA